MKFEDQKFLLHVTEENNEMKFSVTILGPAPGTQRNFSAHVVLGNHDGTIPVSSTGLPKVVVQAFVKSVTSSYQNNGTLCFILILCISSSWIGCGNGEGL